jgi:hypothetical protein
MATTNDPQGTITLTFADLAAFASAVMCIARIAETPGTGLSVGLFGAGEFRIACSSPAPGVIGDDPQWNPVTVNGQQVGNRYRAEKVYTHAFFLTQQAKLEAQRVAATQLAIECYAELRGGKKGKKEVATCAAS